MDMQKSFWATVPGVLTGVAALLTAVGGMVAAIYQARDRAPEPASAVGALLIEASEADAHVFLNGVLRGLTTAQRLPLEGLPAGWYAVRLAKDGYSVWEESHEVEAGRDRIIVARLQPLPTEGADTARPARPTRPTTPLGGAAVTGSSAPAGQAGEEKASNDPPIAHRSAIHAFRGVDRSRAELEVTVNYTYNGAAGTSASQVYMSAVALQADGAQVPRTHFEGLGGPGEVRVGNGTTTMLIRKHALGMSRSISVRVCIIARDPFREVVCNTFPYLKVWS